VVFEPRHVQSPELARASVALVDFGCEFEVDALDGGGEKGGAGAGADGEEFLSREEEGCLVIVRGGDLMGFWGGRDANR